MISNQQDELNEFHHARLGKLEQESNEFPEADETELKVAACQPTKAKSIARNRMLATLSCQQHNQVDCSECQALVTICQARM